MRAARWAVARVCAPLLWTAACSAFGGSDTVTSSTDSGANDLSSDAASTSDVVLVDARGDAQDGGVVMSTDDAAASQLCGRQSTPPFLCQDFDEGPLAAGWYLGAFRDKGNFTEPPKTPASLTVDKGYAHGYAPTAVNQAFVTSNAFKPALVSYTLAIKFHVGAVNTGSAPIAVLRGSKGDLTLAATPGTVTLVAPSQTLSLAMDTSADHVVTVKYDGAVAVLSNDQGQDDMLVNQALQLGSVDVGIGQPENGPAETFIDYYLVTTP